MIAYIPLIAYVLCLFSGCVAQVAADGAETEYILFVMKLLEYGVGISALAALVTGALEAICFKSYTQLLVSIFVILLCNLLIPIAVDMMFVVIIVGVIMGVFYIALAHIFGPFLTWLLQIFGFLTPVLAVAGIGAMIFASFTVGKW